MGRVSEFPSITGEILTNAQVWGNHSFSINRTSNVGKPYYSITDTGNLNGWITAQVPGTILTSLVNNYYYPDPYISLNNEQIPDAHDVDQGFYQFWYYLNISLPSETNFKVNAFKAKAKNGEKCVADYDYTVDHYFLYLRGVNYEFEVFVNSFPLSDTTMKGMFKQQDIEITPYLLYNPNYTQLAIMVKPPFPPGKGNGGQCGDGEIARSVTSQYMAGWDWIAPTRDRSTGIWDKLMIYSTGEVKIEGVFVTSEVKGVRSPINMHQDDVLLDVNMDLISLTHTNQFTIVCFELYEGDAPPNLSTSTYVLQHCENIQISALESKAVKFSSLKLISPKLWWPIGFGKQDLYHSVVYVLTGENAEKKISDSTIFQIGIRDLKYKVENNSAKFYVNGNPIFIRGGNWIGMDAMYRFSKFNNYSDSDLPTLISQKMEYYYDQEVKFHAEMNFNMIRVWGGGTTERPEFFEACDRRGLLVWQEFWITGDCNGEWYDSTKLNTPQIRQHYPDDHPLFLSSAKDSIMMLRNHPSLAIWVGGNEYPPPSDITKGVSELVATYGNTTSYIDYSLTGGFGPNDGPYTIQDIKSFYSYTDMYVFNPELGSVGTPTVESLLKFIPEDEVTPFYNPIWDYHKYIPYNSYINLYGTPKTIQTFCRNAQILNYLQYKHLLESRGERMWQKYNGLIIWKSQSPWTDMRGQFYDYYGEHLGGFFGTKSALENVHIQLDPTTRQIYVINHSLLEYQIKNANFSIFTSQNSSSSIMLFKYNVNSSQADLPCVGTTLAPNSVLSCGVVPQVTDINFISLLVIAQSTSNLTFSSLPSTYYPSPAFGGASSPENFSSSSFPSASPRGVTPFVPFLISPFSQVDSSLNDFSAPLQLDSFLDKPLVVSSNNIYWESARHDEFASFSSLPMPNLTLSIHQFVLDKSNFFYSFVAEIMNNSTLDNENIGAVAFFIRLRVVNALNEDVLPVSYDDNYFTLFAQQSRNISVSFSYFAPLSSPGIYPLKLSVTEFNFHSFEIDIA